MSSYVLNMLVTKKKIIGLHPVNNTKNTFHKGLLSNEDIVILFFPSSVY